MTTPIKDGLPVPCAYLEMPDGKWLYVPFDAPEARRIAEQHAQLQHRTAAAYESLDRRFGGAPEPQLVPYDDHDRLNMDAQRAKAEHARRLRLMGYNV